MPESLLPEWYQYISSEHLLPKEIYGGKAHGLSLLQIYGLRTPRSVVIPCHYSVNKDRWDSLNDNVLDSIRAAVASHYVAVRSGASVSMPGLMETKLDVPTKYASKSNKELRQAIVEVWESWHSEKAIQYRESMGINHNMGTAVVIQRMLSPMASGVAFTADPNKPHERQKMKAIIEWVRGKGDKLVGGEVKPYQGLLDMKLVYQGVSTLTPQLQAGVLSRNAELMHGLRTMHGLMGPSDMEWVLSGDKIHFVQWRPLKFIQDIPEESHANVEKGQLITKGVVIGQPTSVTGRLSFVERYQPGDILFVSHFTPDEIKHLITAKAILCSIGGQLCHAAIVARSMGKSAISELPNMQFRGLQGKYVTITPDGSIYLAKDEVVITTVEAAKKEDKLFETDKQAVPEKPEPIPLVLDPSRMPDARYWTIPFSISANGLIVRFYKNLDRRLKNEITQERFAEITHEIARILNSYFWLASLGEARHTARCNKGHSTAALRAKFKEHGIYFPSADQSYNRNEYVKGYVQPPKDIEQAHAILGLVIKCFEDFPWSGGSFGGKKWANIARTVMMYLEGTYNDEMFVDACFNLEHNGGCAFNKFSWCVSEPNTLKTQLDVRRISDNIDELIAASESIKNLEYADLNYICDLETRTLHAGKFVCCGCGEVFQDKTDTVEVHGATYHEFCAPAKNVACYGECGKLIHCVACAYIADDGKKYHHSCAPKPIICVGCGTATTPNAAITGTTGKLFCSSYCQMAYDSIPPINLKQEKNDEVVEKKSADAKPATKSGGAGGTYVSAGTANTTLFYYDILQPSFGITKNQPWYTTGKPEKSVQEAAQEAEERKASV